MIVSTVPANLIRLHLTPNGEQITLHHPENTNAHFILITSESALFFTGNGEPGLPLDGLDLTAFANQWLKRRARVYLAGMSSTEVFQTLKTKFFPQAA